MEAWLPAEIAVVAPTGDIVRTNRKWDDTARSGKLPDRRWNYLDECAAATKRGCAEAEKVAQGLRDVLSGALPLAAVTYSCPFGGLHHWFEALIAPMPLSGRRHALIMHVDVTGLQHDGLTGLANRAYFDAQLEYVLDMARRSGRLVGVVSVDVDNLKPLNDTYGHQVGDQALKAVASKLSARTATVCAGCVVCRVGGDEFSVVLPPVPDETSLQRILAQFEPRLFVNFALPSGQVIAVRASIGAARYPVDGTTVSALYKAADRAVYAVKRGSPSAA